MQVGSKLGEHTPSISIHLEINVVNLCSQTVRHTAYVLRRAP
jgi:hypothetical protein